METFLSPEIILTQFDDPDGHSVRLSPCPGDGKVSCSDHTCCSTELRNCIRTSSVQSGESWNHARVVKIVLIKQKDKNTMFLKTNCIKYWQTVDACNG